MRHEFRNSRKKVNFGDLPAGEVFISDSIFPGEPCMVVYGEFGIEAIHLFSGERISFDHHDTVTPYKATVILE